MKRDSEEFLALITGCQSSLYAYILSLIPNAQRAEDLLQETNLVLWRKAEEFKRGTSFMAWACQVAYFNVLAFRRKMARDKHTFGDELFDYLAQRQIERADELEERRLALRQCLEKLPPKHRAAIKKRYAPGGSVQAMADDDGTTEGAVSQMLYRIRGSLLSCIQKALVSE